MVESHQVQQRGVQVVDVGAALNGGEPKLVGRPVRRPALHPAAGQPDAEPVVVVVSSVDLAGVRAGRGHFDDRRAAELSAAQHQRFVQEPAAFQVRQQGGVRPIALLRQRAVARE